MFLYLILVIVILGTFFLLIYSVRQIALNQAEYKLEKEHNQIVSNIETYLDTLENISFTVSYSTTVQNYLQEEDMLKRIMKYDEMRTQYMNTTTMLRDIKGFYLYNADFNNILCYGQCIEKFQTEAMGISIGREIQYSCKYVTSTGIPVFSVIYPVYRVKATRLLGEIMGYAGLTADAGGLANLIQKAGIYPESRLYLIDQSGSVLASNIGDASGEGIPEEGIPEEAAEPIPDQARSIRFQTLISGTGWQLISVMPKGIVAQEFQPLVPLMYAAGCLVAALIIFTAALIYSQVFRPIRRLSDFMARVPAGAEPIRYRVENRNEIGIMAETMNHMLDALSERSEELRVSETERLNAQLARQQMEILAYRNQINPHFLYNTLECIRGIAFYHNAPEIVTISQALSRMLRYAVKGGGIVLVREEIRYIREYAKIIDYRFSHRISLTCEIPEEMYDMPIIKLCLQPLVENAVSHGLETQLSKGEIVISGRMEDGRIVLTVEDNGAGIGEETLVCLRDTIEKACRAQGDLPAAEQHIGISNIARRLYLNYGTGSRIQIVSSPGSGTRVTIEIPVEKEA